MTYLRKKVARAIPPIRASQVEGSTTRGQHSDPYLVKESVKVNLGQL